MMLYKSRNIKDGEQTRRPRRGLDRVSSASEGTSSADTLTQTSGLQNTETLAKWDITSLRNIFSLLAETIWYRPGRGFPGWSASSRSPWSQEAQDQGQVSSGMTQDSSNGHHQTNHPGSYIPEEHQVEPMVGVIWAGTVAGMAAE